MDCGPLTSFGNDPSFLLPTTLPGLQGCSTLSDFPAVRPQHWCVQARAGNLRGKIKALEKEKHLRSYPHHFADRQWLSLVGKSFTFQPNSDSACPHLCVPNLIRSTWNWWNWGSPEIFQPGSLWIILTPPIIRDFQSRYVGIQRWLRSWHGMAQGWRKSMLENGIRIVQSCVFPFTSGLKPSASLKPPQKHDPGVNFRQVCRMRFLSRKFSCEQNSWEK